MARRELVDEVTVATRHGGAGLGPALDAERTVLGRARLERTLTRNDRGEEVAGKLSLKLAPVVVDQADELELDALEVFTLGSRVTALGVSGVIVAVGTAGARGRVERVDVTVA